VHFTCQREHVYLSDIERVPKDQGQDETNLEMFSA